MRIGVEKAVHEDLLEHQVAHPPAHFGALARIAFLADKLGRLGAADEFHDQQARGGVFAPDPRQMQGRFLRELGGEPFEVAGLDRVIQLLGQ